MAKKIFPLTVILPIVTPSPNVLLRMHWTERRKIKNDYMTWLAMANANDDKYKAKWKEKRKIQIISYRKRLLDPDNLVGSFKLLIDAVQETGLIFDDSPEYLILLPSEQEIDRENQRTEITIYLEERDVRHTKR